MYLSSVTFIHVPRHVYMIVCYYIRSTDKKKVIYLGLIACFRLLPVQADVVAIELYFTLSVHT